MTTPTPAPAMTAKRLAEIARAITPYPGKELFAYIDALTARVAELEREYDERVDALDAKLAALAPHGSCGCSYDKPGDVCGHHSPQVQRLESELAAARKVEDGEVKRWVSNLQAAGGNQGSFTESERLRYRTLADLLTRLSAALKVVEAKLESARRDALEEAATHVERAANMPSAGVMRFAMLEIVKQIRALIAKGDRHD